MQIELECVNVLRKRLSAPEPLIQVLLGPRQVGKTTSLKQLVQGLSTPSIYMSADDALTPSRAWVLENWQKAILRGPGTVLMIDEIQKVDQWSTLIKSLWDARSSKSSLKLVLAGSSSLDVQMGLTESLAGRFELIRMHHWNYWEMKKAFNLSWENFLLFGGYPGSIQFVDTYERWFEYVKKSIVDAVIGQDILSVRTIQKPALFRQAFELLCHYPAQEISYNKLLGQLQDRGNVDLIKHYIDLYEGAFMFRALSKYSAKPILRKSSSPKLLPLCPALFTLAEGPKAAHDNDSRGRVFEMVVGSDLNRVPGDLYYWREGDKEVDYVYVFGGKVFAIEVKSGRRRGRSGLELFCTRHKKAFPIVISPETYFDFSLNPANFLDKLSH
jgi:predicted AAA+ superfamily ATPase